MIRATASLFLILALSACIGTPMPVAPPEVDEVRPGILAGYLSDAERPDSLALLPPPPAEGTAAFAADEEAARRTFPSRGSDRWKQGIIDADLHFPAAAAIFRDALGFAVTEEETPWTYRILRRTLADAGLSTYGAKNHYERSRPFMKNGEPTGTPDEEEGLRTDGSYPSGHTAAGWGWALILAELVPDRADAILARGYAYGVSRMVINVHWKSDVEAGRVIASAAVAALHANAEFQADFERAKAEVAKIRKAKAD